MLAFPLPRHPSSWELRAFWLVLSGLVGLTTGGLLAIAVSPAWFPAGLAAGAAMAIPGWRNPTSISTIGRLWNGVARRYFRFATWWTLAVCFFVVVSTVGRAGSRLPLARPSATGSQWVRRPADREGVPPGPTQVDPLRQWVGMYLDWGARTKNRWAWALLPFLVILSLIGQQREASAPEGIYTLF